MLKETKQTLSCFHGHITDCLIGSPLTNELKIDLSSEYFGELKKPS